MADTEELLKRWSAIAPVEDDQWRNTTEGPSVLALGARLSAVPAQFLDERISVRAVTNDIVGPWSTQQLTALEFTADDRVRRGLAIGLWLFASESVLAPLAPGLINSRPVLALDALGLRLAPIVDPALWLSDAERREEAVRTFLLWNGQVPHGETAPEARAALAARDSLRFNEALAASFAEHRHRDELRRRLEEARAREAAARYTRE